MKKLLCLVAILLFLFSLKNMDAGPKNETYGLDSTLLDIETVATHINVGWDMVWGPDNRIWFTEQDGKVRQLDPVTGKICDLLQIPDYYRKRLGLMSMALHPDWKANPHVFINYSHIRPDSSIVSKLVRYTYDGKKLVKPVLLYEIPGYLGHNGSKLTISKDRKIMWATGDLKQKETIQNPAFANGKILRLNLDGTIPADNPFPGSSAWAMGFRVPQGLAYTNTGQLFVAEHGDATDDEVNRITKGESYGWPEIAGYCNLPEEKSYYKNHNSIMPVKAWTPTIAPAGMDYYNGNIAEWKNSLLLCTLKDQSLRILHLDPAQEQVTTEEIHFQKKFGRLRDVCVSPSGDIYISTSNRDWNPPADFPIATDDRIIRIRRKGIIPVSSRSVKKVETMEANSAASLYTSFCQSCHKQDGKGVAGSFPSLVGSGKLAGEKDILIKLLLKGSQAGTGEQMPAFSFMSDDQLAKILTYARKEFGNGASGIDAQEVNLLRQK
jgi:glucose/arabinose dehydrogenase/cytochrome c551/c552